MKTNARKRININVNLNVSIKNYNIRRTRSNWLDFNYQEEPMDVDQDDAVLAALKYPTDNALPINKTEDLLSCDECNSSEDYDDNLSKNKIVNNLKRRLVIRERHTKSYRTKLFLSILAAIFGALGILYYYYYTDNKDNTSIIHNISEELKEHVHFQDEAIQLIIKNIECMNSSSECKKILPLIGSTGVGKTLVANIVKKHFPGEYTNEINGFKLNNLKEVKNVIKTINEHVCNLIIMDDLKSEDTDSVLDFINALPSIRCLLVIPIFNIQETKANLIHEIHYDDFKTIPNKLKEAGIKCEAILFNVITEGVVMKWLQDRNYDRDHYLVVKKVLAQQDFKHYGLKGIEAKVLLLLNEFPER